MGQKPEGPVGEEGVAQDAGEQEVPSLADDRTGERQAYLERLKAEIASGTYRVSAESLASRLARRIRWW